MLLLSAPRLISITTTGEAAAVEKRSFGLSPFLKVKTAANQDELLRKHFPNGPVHCQLDHLLLRRGHRRLRGPGAQALPLFEPNRSKNIFGPPTFSGKKVPKWDY